MKTKKLGGVAKTVIAQRQPADEVLRDMIEKDHPLTDAPEQIEPQVALGGTQGGWIFLVGGNDLVHGEPSGSLESRRQVFSVNLVATGEYMPAAIS